MKVWPYLSSERIFLDVPLKEKDAVLRFVAEAFAGKGIIKDADSLYEGIVERENVMSTGIGNGIGIPHCVSEEVTDAALLLIRLAQSVEFDSIDGSPVQIIWGLVVPTDEQDLHLRVLTSLARLCQNPNFKRTVVEAEDSRRLFDQIVSLEDTIACH